MDEISYDCPYCTDTCVCTADEELKSEPDQTADDELKREPANRTEIAVSEVSEAEVLVFEEEEL